MSYLEELLPEFRKGAKIRQNKWENDAYIEKCAQGIIYHNIEEHDVDILANDYELYQEPEPDWEYIIKNKCLCWFWDEEDLKCLGLLIRFPEKKDQFQYKTNIHNGVKYFKNCCPVRRDEVTFYEDRNDNR